jgi:thymidylate kinase
MGITRTEVPSFSFHVSIGHGDEHGKHAFSLPFAGTRVWNGLRRRQDIRQGLWVVLLGMDGAGKSSVIAGIGNGVAAGFAGSDAYHLRPLTLRGRRGADVNRNPHRQAARGRLVTGLKLAYLFVLNWLGYLAVVRPRVARGRLVMFDRYFADYLVDRRRYRVPASCEWLVERVAKSMPQPDLYLVLDAPAHVLRARKPELTAMEAERQCVEYRRLAASLRNAAVICADQTAAAVLEEVVQRVIEAHLSVQRRALKAA